MTEIAVSPELFVTNRVTFEILVVQLIIPFIEKA